MTMMKGLIGTPALFAVYRPLAAAIGCLDHVGIYWMAALSAQPVSHRRDQAALIQALLVVALVLIVLSPFNGVLAADDPFAILKTKGEGVIDSLYPIMRIIGFFGLVGVITMGFFKKWNWVGVFSLAGAFLMLAMAPTIIGWFFNGAGTATGTGTGSRISGG